MSCSSSSSSVADTITQKENINPNDRKKALKHYEALVRGFSYDTMRVEDQSVQTVVDEFEHGEMIVQEEGSETRGTATHVYFPETREHVIVSHDKPCRVSLCRTTDERDYHCVVQFHDCNRRLAIRRALLHSHACKVPQTLLDAIDKLEKSIDWQAIVCGSPEDQEKFRKLHQRFSVPFGDLIACVIDEFENHCPFYIAEKRLMDEGPLETVVEFPETREIVTVSKTCPTNAKLFYNDETSEKLEPIGGNENRDMRKALRNVLINARACHFKIQ